MSVPDGLFAHASLDAAVTLMQNTVTAPAAVRRSARVLV